MALRTYSIELRVNFDDPEKEEILQEAAKVAAKHLYTTAMFIPGLRKPQIRLQTGDLFAGEEEIMLAESIPSDEDDNNEASEA